MNILYSQNLVLNGGFEEFYKCPKELGDFYPLHWRSIAYNSSPDLYSFCANKNGSASPDSFYSQVKPYKDSSYAGIVLGLKKNNYREYIGTSLSYKLKKGKTYIFKISVAVPVMARYKTRSLDIVFSDKTIFSDDGHTILEKTPSLTIDLDSVKTDGTWTTFTFEYIADGIETNLNIGNFKSKKQTSYIEIQGRNKDVYKTMYDQVYVCIDDVQLYLKETSNNQLTLKDDVNKNMEQVYIIEGINFETGSSKIENEEIPELEKIAELLLINIDLSIQIIGYTDNVGDNAKNKILSLDRAISVKKYLVEKGIHESRILTLGKGSDNPRASNDTEEGRLQNRRIEVIIL